jgi:hypothetical protein
MSNLTEQENILCTVKSHKDVKNSQVIVNFITNLISRGVAGGVTNEFKLVLTDKNLYIESIGYSPWGGLSEVLNTETIAIKNIETFNVEVIENESIIRVNPVNKKGMLFVCNSEDERELASAMARLIPDLKNL